MKKLVVLLLPSVVTGRRAVAALRVAQLEHHVKLTDWALAYKDDHRKPHLEEGHGNWRPGAHAPETLAAIDAALDPGEAMVLVLADEDSATKLVEGLTAPVGAGLDGFRVDRQLVRVTAIDVEDARHVYKVLRGLTL